MIITIDKQMILRHQVQLAEFFRKSFDSVIVATEQLIEAPDPETKPSPEILLYNKTIKSMLGVNMSGVQNEEFRSTIFTPLFRLIGDA